MNRNNKNAGNVLFLILIAVALFAALSYAVTSSMRGGGGDASNEKAVLTATEILNTMNAMVNAYMRMKIVNGCNDNAISFYKTGYPAAGSETWAGYLNLYGEAIPDKCNLYHPQGGGIAAPLIPAAAGEPAGNIPVMTKAYLPLRAYISGVGRDYANYTDFDASELVITAAFTNKKVCQQFNKLSGFSSAEVDPLTSTAYYNFLAGECANSSSRTCSTWLSDGGMLGGKTAGCIYQPNNSGWLVGPRYTAYMVMQAN